MKSFIKQNQISFFFALTLLIGWLPWYTGQGSIIIAAPSIAAHAGDLCGRPATRTVRFAPAAANIGRQRTISG